ncbi:MAG: porin family protein [Prevotella sp.]|jgi:hypothetical protein|nr:porin family protein [Prevotella sp.]
MRNDNEDRNKNFPDEFSELIRQKLENHKVTVDNDCWNGIESRIVSSKPKRDIKRWVTGIAAAAAFIGAVFLLMPDQAPLSSDIAKVLEQEDYALSEKRFIEMEKELAMSEPTEEQSFVTKAVAFISSANKATDKPKASDGENIDISKTPTQEIENNQPVEDQEKKDEAVQTSKNADVKRDNRSNVFEQGKILLPKKKGNDNWTMAASFTSNGSISSSGDGLNSLKSEFQSSPSITNGEDDGIILRDPGEANTKFLSSRDFPEVEHDLPLSFGFTVRKDINKHFGVETGLMYTYLSSTFKRTNIPQYQSKQELHYLGVPVNLVVYILNDPKWNVYVSAGGMVEKGLTRKYTQEMYQTDDKTSAISEKGSISGLQWSLNASVGVGYNFYKDIGAYVEPRFSHYFENNQPVSVRTEKKSVFGLGAGLRYKF